MHHSDYVPLHIHTEYSLLDGAIKISELIDAAASFRLPALAITDHGNLFGTVEFYTKARKAGIKPIIGCEIYVAPKSRFDREKNAGEYNHHLLLLARDHDGYRNLVTLVTKAYLEGFYYKPRIDMDLLEQYSGGLIGLSSCMKGEVPGYLKRDSIDKAREAALRYKHILGADNFFLELQDNGLEEQNEVNRKLVELSRELHIPVVATNDCHYLRSDDVKAHDVLLCIQTGKTVNTPERMKFKTDQLYFKSPAEMKEAFKDIPEAVTNTVHIAERCNVEFKLGQYLLPEFPIEEGQNADSYLESLSREGLKQRFPGGFPEAYSARLTLELSVIKKMGYSSYFLIVWDFINYAKQRSIPVGPGRGSAAGSLVSYALGITEIDPLKYNLLFERFLNPERISMPDIDIDFCKNRRPEVISYVAEKYGQDHVAQIITFGTMAARAAIRDVGRALDIPYADVDRIAKLVPPALNITIDDALKAEPKLREIYQSDERYKELIDIARRLEGLARHASTHAAGVVISPEPLTDYTPLYRNPTDESITTQFDMNAIEKIGLLKFDFLGLKTLTVIDKTITYIRESGKTIDLAHIPFDDANTYELLGRGDTTGVFQLESDGMRDILVKMLPNRFEDLIALVALYRPGPIGSGMIEDFIKRKRGITEVKYDLPQLKDILDETYGVILYQEQVMRIANALASFTMGEADILRKAMGKKKPEEMEKLKEKFISGALKNGIPAPKAERIFDLMSYFAEYGFNKSHSAAYAYVAYQTAYLKATFPVEFMAATLSADMDNSDKVVKFITECRNMNIEILPPDINQSDREFRVMGNSIRFGLEAVKGAGSAAIDSIIEARQAGPFLSSEDFLSRVDPRRVNKKVIEKLIKAGSFDSICPTRKQALAALEGQNGRSATPSLFGQESFAAPGEPQPAAAEWEEHELLAHEKEALGFYITGHPLSKFRNYLESLRTMKTSLLNQHDKLRGLDEVLVAGIISSIRKSQTKSRQETMANFTLEDEEGFVDVIAFPDVYKKFAALLVKDGSILVKGSLELSEKGTKVHAREILPLDSEFDSDVVTVELRIPANSPRASLLQAKKIAQDHSGKCPLYVKLTVQGCEALIATRMSLSVNRDVISSFENVFGKNTVRIDYHESVP
ncbi:MAG: DNA polymerase III subunit alpha [bacterium]